MEKSGWGSQVWHRFSPQHAFKKTFLFLFAQMDEPISSPGFLPSALAGRAKGIIHGPHTMYNTAAKEMIHPST